LNNFPNNLQAFRKFISNLENRQFTQAHLADLLFSSTRQIVRWENPDYAPSVKQVAVFADGVSRYFGRIGLKVTAEDVLRPDFVAWLKEQVLASGKERKEGGQAASYSERSLERLLTENESMCRLLGVDDVAMQFLRSKLKLYRSDLTEQDWIAIFQLYLAGELEREEWKFADAEVVTARLHFKSPRPLTAKELKVAERAAWEAVRQFQLSEQAKRKKDEE